MSNARRLKCVHHFHHVVTSSADEPTCRGCGLPPTPEEEAAGIEALERWKDSRNRATVRPQRNSR